MPSRRVYADNARPCFTRADRNGLDRSRTLPGFVRAMTGCRHAIARTRALRLNFAAIVAMASVSVSLVPPTAVAQRNRQGLNLQQRQMQARRGAFNRRGAQPPSVVIELSAPIANLFRRANEGVERSDWKFAIDSLQRIIDDPRGSLVPRSDGAAEDGVLFETARRRAIHRLAALPAEGRRAYRLLFDGRAKRLWELGRANHDPVPLRAVVNRYLLTRYGDDAVDLLASWALDAGHAGEAVLLIHDLLELVPEYDVPASLIVSKLAAAQAMLGQADEGQTELDRYLAEHGADDLPGVVATANALASIADATTVDALAGRAWPVAGGSSARRGQMPETEPTFIADSPWQFGLPRATSGAWRRVFRDDPRTRLYLPVAQLVADQELLFARTRDGCVGLDRNDLSLVWTASDGVPTTGDAPPALPDEPLVGRLSGVSHGFDDFVGGGLSLAQDLVTLVARRGRGEYTQGARDTGRRRLIPRFTLPGFLPAQARGNRLVALDAQTGEQRWQRGRTADADDALGEVDFRAPTLSVNGRLWVPYFKKNDLYVAVLDPSDGALVRSVLLGAMSGDPLPQWYALPLAAEDGLVFVPSGYGVLFAVDANDYTVRWASQYSRKLDVGNGLDWGRGSSWLPTAPVVSGGLVLLAPFEGDSMMAFSAATGQWQWTVPCRDCSYILAADRSRVWVGGRRVRCLSLADGSQLWAADLPTTPTGRAVRCGDTILAPVLDGVVSFDATTGVAVASKRLPDSVDPLGNPLCLGDALFVIDASTVRKFPDLDRGFVEAIARHEVASGDKAATVQLAWMQLFRGDAAAAQRTIDAFVAGTHAPADGSPVGNHELAHVRVRILFALADELAPSATSVERAIALLKMAADVARTPADRLAARLAIAERLIAAEAHGEAYLQLWEIGLSPEAEQVHGLAAHVEGMARFDVAGRLQRLAKSMNAAERSRVHRVTEEGAAAAVAAIAGPAPGAAALARVRAVIDLDGFSPTGQRAMLALARYHARRLQFESAEQLLRAVVRVAADRDLTVTAWAQLCVLFLEAGSSGLDAEAGLLEELDALDREYGTLLLPESVELPGSAGEPVLSGMTVHAWVEAMRVAGPGARSAVRPSPWDTPMGLSGELVWALSWDQREQPLRVVDFGPRAPAVLADRFIVFGQGEVVSCYDAGNAEVLLWRATLRLPETFRTVRGTPNFPDSTAPPRHAVADGQTAVFAGADGLFGVGLLTGRRLWVRAFELAGDGVGSAARDMAMAAGDGLLAAMPKAGRLTLMRMLDGTTVWERDLRGERVADVRLIGNRVVTVDPKMERVHLFDRSTGRVVRQLLFDQPDRAGDFVRVVSTGGVLCGPVSTDAGDEVAAFSVESGEPVWRIKLEKPLAQLFEVQEGFVAIAMHGGDVRIVEVSTGEAMPDRRMTGTQKIVGGALVDGTLVLQHASRREEGRFGRLAAIDLATGEELWRRDDVTSLSGAGELLKTVGGCTPVVVTRTSSGGRGREALLLLIDLRTGRNVGGPFVVASGGARSRLNGDIEIHARQRVLVVGGDDAIRGLRLEPVPDVRKGL